MVRFCPVSAVTSRDSFTDHRSLEHEWSDEHVLVCQVRTFCGSVPLEIHDRCLIEDVEIATHDTHVPIDAPVIVFYRDAQREANVEIVRVDTDHGYTHIDRLYRHDEPKERVDWDFWEACTRLKRNWGTYARSFDEK